MCGVEVAGQQGAAAAPAWLIGRAGSGGKTRVENGDKSRPIPP